MIADTLNFNALEEIIRQVELTDGRQRQPPWTDEESQFVIDNYQHMSNAEIGSYLDRSATAVKLHVRRKLRLPARSKNPEYITSYQMGEELGIDPHKTWHWVDCGMIKRADIPQAPTIRIVKRTDYLRWAINKQHWIYFDIRGVKNRKLRKFLKHLAGKWGDEWWTTRQAADYWNVDPKDIERYIKSNRLFGVQPEHSLGGRVYNRTWSNWFVRRSDVLATRIWSKTNGMQYILDMEFPPAADEFLIKAVEELKLNSIQAGRAMKKKRSTVTRRYHQLTGKHLPHQPKNRRNK